MGKTWTTSIHIYTRTRANSGNCLNSYITFHNYALLSLHKEKQKKLLLKLVTTHNSFIITITGLEISSASKYLNRAIYLLLKASKCVFSIKSPLSIIVRLEWESCSRLLEAIIRLSIHLLINSCSFSRPVLPVIPVKVNYRCTTLGLRILILKIKRG